MRATQNPIDPIEKKHQHDFILRILAPVLIVTLVVVVCVVFAIQSSFISPETNEKWANISIIVLISPLLLIGLFFLIVIISLCILTKKLSDWIPGRARTIQQNYNLLSGMFQGMVGQTIDPFIKLRAFLAGAKKLIHISSRKKV